MDYRIHLQMGVDFYCHSHCATNHHFCDIFIAFNDEKFYVSLSESIQALKYSLLLKFIHTYLKLSMTAVERVFRLKIVFWDDDFVLHSIRLVK